MMDGKTSKTCRAVNKRQDNKLEKLLHLVGDLFDLYVDARTYKTSNSLVDCVSSSVHTTDLKVIQGYSRNVYVPYCTSNIKIIFVLLDDE
jgi:hypothetical protein